MADNAGSPIRAELESRRSLLGDALGASPGDGEVARLLEEVDAALARMDAGTYGICEMCDEPIEPERLMADPLARICLSHMTPAEQRVLEGDLELAAQIQAGLLPERSLVTGDWEAVYHYEGLGPVSGDYCDLLTVGPDLYFIIGDVSGKGVAASMLMAHLHATFHALLSQDRPLVDVMERAGRMFCESTLPTHFATLVCGMAVPGGEVHVCSAGHLPALVARGGGVEPVESTGLPLGFARDARFSTSEFALEPGDTMFLYTDGLSEAENASGEEYGTARVAELLKTHSSLPPDELVSECLTDLEGFLSGRPRTDDLTIMAIRRR
jgi:sigma-B regulation protein RsbU (phosphoserine phosphatase)